MVERVRQKNSPKLERNTDNILTFSRFAFDRYGDRYFAPPFFAKLQKRAVDLLICVVSRDFGVQFTILKLKLHSRFLPKNGIFSSLTKNKTKQNKEEEEEEEEEEKLVLS